MAFIAFQHFNVYAGEVDEVGADANIGGDADAVGADSGVIPARSVQITIRVTRRGSVNTVTVYASVIGVDGRIAPGVTGNAAMAGDVAAFPGGAARPGFRALVCGVRTIGKTRKGYVAYAIRMPDHTGILFERHMTGGGLGMTDLAVQIGCRIFQVLVVCRAEAVAAEALL